MRLALIADVHLGTPQTQFPGQDLSYAPELLRLAVTQIESLDPDELIVVGDLVNMGTAEEYALATQILAGRMRARICVIPGNHELVRGSLADFRRLSVGARAAEVDSADGQPMRLYLNSGIEGLTPWHWHGRVDEAGLRALDRATAESGDRALLICCHHPPEGTVLVPEHPMMGLQNTDEVMARLMRHPAPVVLFCGHTHVADVYRRRNVTIVAVPPLCFWPHAFLLAELHDNCLHLTTHRVIESAGLSPDAGVRDPAYVRRRDPWVPQITIRLA